MRMPDLRRRQVWPDRRGRARGARIRSLPLQARRARAAEDELPGVRDRRPGADADAADREGASRPGAARPCRRVEVLRSSLPLHRQAGIYARSGVEIDRSVMAGWIGRLANGLFAAPTAAASSGRVLINHTAEAFLLAEGPHKRFLPRGPRNPLKRLDSEKEIKVNSKKNPRIFQTITVILGYQGKFQGIPRLAPSVSP